MPDETDDALETRINKDLFMVFLHEISHSALQVQRCASALEQSPHVSPKGRDVVSALTSAAERLDHHVTVANSLFWRHSFGEYGSITLHELRRILQRCIEVVPPMMRPRHRVPLSVSFSVDDESSRISANRVTVRDVAIALLSNAVQFSFDKKPVVVAVIQTSDGVEMRISNVGLPFPTDYLELVGKSAFTGSGSAGAGLGLLFVDKAMRRVGGQLVVKADGEKTTAVARFPRHQGENDERSRG
ncbi:MAG: ATP-binding protein [Vicinamibacteria bacterium]